MFISADMHLALQVTSPCMTSLYEHLYTVSGRCAAVLHEPATLAVTTSSTCT